MIWPFSPGHGDKICQTYKHTPFVSQVLEIKSGGCLECREYVGCSAFSVYLCSWKEKEMMIITSCLVMPPTGCFTVWCLCTDVISTNAPEQKNSQLLLEVPVMSQIERLDHDFLLYRSGSSDLSGCS